MLCLVPTHVYVVLHAAQSTPLPSAAVDLVSAYATAAAMLL